MAAADDAEQRLVTMVHDLRTPLTIVVGFAELLARRGEDLAAEQRQEYIARIDEAAREMRSILDRERNERTGD
jgi:signal transduction histidine kinase